MREGGRKRNKIEESCKTNFKREKCSWTESSPGNLIFKPCLSPETKFQGIEKFRLYALNDTARKQARTMHTEQTYQKTFLPLKENANSKAVPKMDTHQTEPSRTENSFHMVATSSTLVMQRTLWMAQTFCIATMAFGTLAFPRARVCTHSLLTWRWTLNYHYHLEKVRSNSINAF